MPSVGPRHRTASLLLLVPVAFIIAAQFGHIQTLLVAIGLGYAGLAWGVLWLHARDSDGPTITSTDVLLRRGGAWALLLFTVAMAVLISGRLLAGALGVVLIYAGGAFDQAGLRLARRTEVEGARE